jgi:hypothetical protein
VDAQRCANEAASRKPQRGKTPEIGRSESLKRCKSARTERNQLSGGKNAAMQSVFPQTPKDAENSDQEKVPGRDADPTSPSDGRDGAQEADQVKIGCGSWGIRQDDTAIPPRTPQPKHLGQTAWDRQLISPGDSPIRVIMSSDADQGLGARALPYDRRAPQ